MFFHISTILLLLLLFPFSIGDSFLRLLFFLTCSHAKCSDFNDYVLGTCCVAVEFTHLRLIYAAKTKPPIVYTSLTISFNWKSPNLKKTPAKHTHKQKPVSGLNSNREIFYMISIWPEVETLVWHLLHAFGWKFTNCFV